MVGGLEWAMPPEEKKCLACGRAIQWRKKWDKNWEQVKWCSDRCRRQKVRPVDQELEGAIRRLLECREGKNSSCPSEAARVVAPTAWQELLEPARSAARRLIKAGAHEIIQNGRVVDPSTARGPIRIRRVKAVL